MNYKELTKKARDEYDKFRQTLNKRDYTKLLLKYTFDEILFMLDPYSYHEELISYLDSQDLSEEVREEIINVMWRDK